jgi:hypothetical protein
LSNEGHSKEQSHYSDLYLKKKPFKYINVINSIQFIRQWNHARVLLQLDNFYYIFSVYSWLIEDHLVPSPVKQVTGNNWTSNFVQITFFLRLNLLFICLLHDWCDYLVCLGQRWFVNKYWSFFVINQLKHQ